MPYIITTSYFPSDKADEANEAFFEMYKKYPPDENLSEIIFIGANKRTEKGIEAQGVVKVKKGKIEETLDLIERQLTLFKDIVGFESKTEIWRTAEESLAILGMEPPV